MTLVRRVATVATAAMVAVVLSAIAVEAWVRLSWDDRREQVLPGLLREH
jgi:hypothetical protein